METFTLWLDLVFHASTPLIAFPGLSKKNALYAIITFGPEPLVRRVSTLLIVIVKRIYYARGEYCKA